MSDIQSAGPLAPVRPPLQRAPASCLDGCWAAAIAPGAALARPVWSPRQLLALSAAGGVALAVAYPNLPDIGGITDYQPKLPLRIFSADGVLIGEFGEERRSFVPIAEMPKVMRDAVLAAEDARFYEHSGVDYKGVLRAGLANFGGLGSQGASTITMQVAKNFYLSTEKTLTRKIYEILLALKIESMLSKDQILELYMNQIYLGQRAYGFAAASEAYFGKPLKDITLAEAAMLAGLPKAPSTFNPIVNPKRATERQHYVIERMLDNGFITEAQRDAAREQRLRYRPPLDVPVHAEYAAETARQLDLRPVRQRGLHARPERDADDRLEASRWWPTAHCARASWTTSGARSTVAPRPTSICPPTRRKSTPASPRRLPTTPTTTSCVPAWRSRSAPKKVRRRAAERRGRHSHRRRPEAGRPRAWPKRAIPRRRCAAAP